MPLAASGAAAACGSLAGEIGLVRGQSTANRRRRRREGEGERKAGDASAVELLGVGERRRDEGEVHARLCRVPSPLGIIIPLHPPPFVPHAVPDTWARGPPGRGYTRR